MRRHLSLVLSAMIITTGISPAFAGKVEDNELAGVVFENVVVDDNPTNKNVTLDLEGEDELSGVKSISYVGDSEETPLSISGTLLKKNGDYIITDNGTYHFIVEDNAGNKTGAKVKISNIDRENPTATITLSNDQPTNQNINIIVKGGDAHTGVKHIIVPGGETKVPVLDDTIEFEVSKNDTYEFTVVDKAGNEHKQSIEVSNINKDLPVITPGPYETGWTNQNVVVTVTSDKGVLIKDTHTFESNDSYVFSATDEYGNTGTKEVVISKIDKVLPTKPGVTVADNVITLVPGTDLDSGINKHQYKFDEGVWEDTLITTSLVDGDYKLHIKAIDNAGNESELFEIPIRKKNGTLREIDEEVGKEDEATVSLEDARVSVAVAQGDPSQTNLDIAQVAITTTRDLVSGLQEGQIKTDLIYELDELQDILDGLIKAIDDQIVIIDQMITDLDDLSNKQEIQDLIDALPEGPKKVKAQEDLDAKVGVLEDKKAAEEAASANVDLVKVAIQAAKDNPTKDNIETAQELITETSVEVGVLVDPVKTELETILTEQQVILDKVISDLDADIKEIEDNIRDLEDPSLGNVIQDKIDLLPEGEDKVRVNQELEDKIKQLQDKQEAEDKATVNVDLAEAAVVVAEGNATKGNIDNAQSLIDTTREEVILLVNPVKDNLIGQLDALQVRLDKVKSDLAAEIQAIEDLITNLNDLDNKETIQDRITALPEGTDKVDLQGKLDVKVAELEAKRDAEENGALNVDKAEAAVVVAEGDATKVNIDTAQDLIDSTRVQVGLLEDPVKTELIGRLDSLQTRLDKVKSDLAEDIKEIEDAIEGLIDLEDKTIIQDLIDKLPEGLDKDRVQKELDDKVIELETKKDMEETANINVGRARAAVIVAEANSTKENIQIAQGLIDESTVEVDSLHEGVIKTVLSLELVELQLRLDAVKSKVQDLIDLIDQMVTDLDDLDDVAKVQDEIDKLPEGEDKDKAQKDLEDKIKILEDLRDKEEKEHDATINVGKAETAVVEAEANPTKDNIDNAQDLIDQVKIEVNVLEDPVKSDLNEILDELQDRLDKVKSDLADLIEQIRQAIIDLDDLANKGTVQDLIDTLPEGQDKIDKQKDLNDKIKQLEDQRDEETKENDATVQVDTVEQAVIKAETNPIKGNIDDAQGLIDSTRIQVEGLQEGIVKTDLNDKLDDLQVRLDAVKQAILDKIEEIETVIRDLDDLENKQAIQDKIDALPEGEDKERVQKELDDKVEELEAIRDRVLREEQATINVDAVEVAVVNAETTTNRTNIHDAQILLNASRVEVGKLLEGPVKIELNSRLDGLQTRLDNLSNQLNDEITEIENAIRDLEDLEGKDTIQDLIEALPDGDEKDRLQKDLDDKIEEIKENIANKAIEDIARVAIDEAELAVSVAEGTRTDEDFTKAQDLIFVAKSKVADVISISKRNGYNDEIIELQKRLDKSIGLRTPVDLELDYDQSDTWKRTLRVTVKATGDFKDITLPNGAKVYDNEFTHIIRTSGTYEFTISGKDGVSSDKKTIITSKIDVTPPILNFEFEDDVTLVTVRAVDTQSGIKKIVLPSGIEVMDTMYEFDSRDEQGTFTVIDNAGNRSSREFNHRVEGNTLINVDGVASDWTNQDIDIKVSAQNKIEGIDSITIERKQSDVLEKGMFNVNSRRSLSMMPTLFSLLGDIENGTTPNDDDGDIFNYGNEPIMRPFGLGGSESDLFETITIGENGVLDYEITNSETTHTGAITITKIDKEKPMLAVSVDYDKVTFSAGDEHSGIRYVYLPNGNILEFEEDGHFSERGTLKMNAVGDFMIAVEDHAGNVTEEVITLSRRPDDTGGGWVPPVEPEEPIKPEVPKPDKPIDPVKPGNPIEPPTTIKPVEEEEVVKPNKPGNNDFDTPIYRPQPTYPSKDKEKDKIIGSTVGKDAYEVAITNVANRIPYTVGRNSNLNWNKILGYNEQDLKIELNTKITGNTEITINLYGIETKYPIEVVSIIPSTSALANIPQKHWAAKYVKSVINKGYISGSDKGELLLENTLTYADSFVSLDRLLISNGFMDLNAGRGLVERKTTGVTQTWYTNSTKSVLSRYNDVELNHAYVRNLTRTITREEIAQVIYNTLKGKVAENQPMIEYKDMKEITNINAMVFCTKAGIIRGNDGYSNPKGELTRAEFMTMLDNVDNLLKQQIRN